MKPARRLVSFIDQVVVLEETHLVMTVDLGKDKRAARFLFGVLFIQVSGARG